MKLYPFILTLVLFLSLNGLLAEGINTVKISARSDLKEAIKELAELRNDIEEDKIPLARNVSTLENRARKLRSELEHFLRLRDNREASLLQLEREVKENESELDFSLNLLNDYLVSWHHGNPSGEKSLWSPKLSEILLQSKEDSSRKTLFESALSSVSLSIKAVRETAGGIAFKGNAIVPPEGTREEGTFWSIGPSTFFSGEEGSAGLLGLSNNNNRNQPLSLSSNTVLKFEPARINPTSSGTSEAISKAIGQTSEGALVILPFDPTLGKALVMEQGELNMFEELQKGGIWIYPIMFFAIISLLIAFLKAFQIMQVQLPKTAATLSGKFKGPFEQLRKTAKGYQGKNPEILEEILYEAIIDTQVKLEKALPLIAVTAATAPLLGLLGTVTGMIDVFRQITNFANPENSELARGISEALVTTKFGLVTAIPALIAHALLNRRLQGIISKMEGFSARLVRLKQEKTDPQKSDQINEPHS